MTGVDLTRIDGVDGFTALKVDQRDWHGYDEMAQRQALRVLAGAEPQQPYHRWQGQELKDQAQRQPGPRRHCTWPPTGCTAPTALWAPSCAGRKRTWERPRPSPPPPTSWPGSSNSMLRYGQDYVDAGAEYYESQYQRRAFARG